MKLITSLAVCQFAGVIGAFFTYPAISGWYAELQKPFFTPPDWVFGPIWIALYALMGIALYLVWVKSAEKITVIKALKSFRLQLILNVLWTVMFFGNHSPIAGLIVMIPLWLTILLTIVRFWMVSRPAAWLMVPYLAWVTIAAVLNLSIMLLN